MKPDLGAHFPRYTEFDPLVPVWCITPDSPRTIHRFFDTSPISPSGRYVGLTRFPFEDHGPAPGDVAEIVLVDLETGQTEVVAESRLWDTQAGAQVQWGASDSELFYNDLDTATWRPFAVKLDPLSGVKKALEGAVYMASRDGKYVASPDLLRNSRTQLGYGGSVPPEYLPVNRGAPADDGVYVTDTTSGECRLIASLRDIVETAEPALDRDLYRNGDFYAFHVKWNPQGTRIMLVLRWLPHDGGRMRPQVITMSPDGSNIRVAIPASEWAKGGHHPNWCPDGEYVMMNLRIAEDGLRLVRARYDGSDYGVMHETLFGSGHPSLHPNGRHIITDAYPHEPLAFADGTVPLRLLDLATGAERMLVRIQAVPPYEGEKKELRVDPHPAWDYSFTRIAFNGCPEQTRQVYIADCSEFV